MFLSNFAVLQLCCNSEFKQLFNWKNFMEVLEDDIHIVDSLPPELAKIKPFMKAPVSWSKAITHNLPK